MAKAAKNKKDSDQPEGTHYVLVPFRDINDFDKEHAEGDDVSWMDKDRLAKLVETGHVEEAH